MSQQSQAMDTGRWQRLNEIFASALEIHPASQSDFLNQICGGDDELQREVVAILAATRNADQRGFLEADVFADAAHLIAANEITAGTIVGGYRIVREIGRGGMGAVYLAEREGFHQQVALKIIKRGMDTEALVRRFVMERDVLASLNHPNIARLLDGGTTTDGLPFIAMEYVEGKTITEYCDEKRSTIEERLLIFRKVCGAVTYAHQNLVVHRDIKPSNILVAPDGEPKLLDFGIAKLLSNQYGHTIEHTATGANLLTPEYASPEQIAGGKITTASDIYSLGVLLYELLCGRRPFSFKNRAPSDVLKIISERQPSAPSTAALTNQKVDEDQNDTKPCMLPETVAEMRSERPARLHRKLAGDLDNIVLMALRKEPLRRYESVQQFAEDLRRHLDGLPVVARPATFSYRAAKFIERNRTATAFATIALLAIVTGLSIAIWQAVVARQQSQRAERRSNEVRRLTNTLLKDLEKEVEALPGSGRAHKKMFLVSIEYLNGLAQETNDPAAWRQLSEAYVLLGKDYGYEGGNRDEIRSNISRGLEISRKLAANDPNDLETKKLLAKNVEEYDYFCETMPDAKLALLQERARLREEITSSTPNDPEAYRELAGAYGNLKDRSAAYDRRDDALRYVQLAVQAREHEAELLEKTAQTARDRDLLSLAYGSLGAAYDGDLNDPQKAEAFYTRALTVAQALVSEHPDYGPLGWMRLNAANKGIALIKLKQGDYYSTLEHFSACLRIIRESNSKVTNVQMQFAEPGYMLAVGESLYRVGQTAEGLQMMRDALALHTRLNQLVQTPTQKSTRQADFVRDAGGIYARMGRVNEALACYREAEALWQKVMESDPGQYTSAEINLAALHMTKGDLYAANSAQRRDARKEYQIVVEVLSKLNAQNQIPYWEKKNLDKARQKLQALAG